jgi:tRNA pseudouridine38-40 synthase
MRVQSAAMPTQRLKLLIAYRGTRYHGWQHQMATSTWKGEIPEEGFGIPTVQEKLTRAIAMVVGHPVSVTGSSRTDAGVHAKGQIAHFDTDQAQIPLEGMRRAVNHRLPDDIVVRQIEPAPEGFDAITCAASKRYQYFIWNTLDRNAFYTELCWHRWQTLDAIAMSEAAAHFVGEHDFSSFAKPGHKRENTIRTVLKCSVSAFGPKVVIGVEGTGFLWNMVRIMAGTLVEVGLGRFTPDDIPKMLAACDRRAGGSTAPPQGLYLQWIRCKEPLPSTSPGLRDGE